MPMTGGGCAPGERGGDDDGNATRDCRKRGARETPTTEVRNSRWWGGRIAGIKGQVDRLMIQYSL